MHLGQVPIADIQFDSNNRDGIPAVLIGLQALWHDENVRVRIREILKKCGSPRFVLLNEKRNRLLMVLAAMLCAPPLNRRTQWIPATDSIRAKDV